MGVFIDAALPWLLTILVIGCAGGLPLLLAYLHRAPRGSEHRPQARDEASDTTC